MLTLAPAALVLALVQRHIVAGLTFGAVTGVGLSLLGDSMTEILRRKGR